MNIDLSFIISLDETVKGVLYCPYFAMIHAFFFSLPFPIPR